MQQGQKVWIEYKEAEYVESLEDGSHVVLIKEKDAETKKTIRYQPLLDDGWSPTGFYKDGNEYLKFSGKKVAWFMGSSGLTLYYEMLSTSTFRSNEHMSRLKIEKLEKVEDSHFLPQEELEDLLYEIDKEISPLEKQVNDLKRQIFDLNAKKKPLYEKCFHQWDKGEERETSKRGGMTSIEQDCTCVNCGKEKTQYSTRL